MSSSMSQIEEVVFQGMVPELEAEGFAVFVHPSRSMLPDFLKRSYQPDAIAVRGERKIAIEVVGGSEKTSGEKARRISALFSGHPEWELRLVYAPERDEQSALPALPRRVIEDQLTRIEGFLGTTDAAAALLIGWAAFEAAGRHAVPDGFERPQTSSRLIETLAAGGYVTPDEADELRSLGRIRNEVAHGRLDLPVTRKQVERLILIVRSVLACEDGRD